MYGKNKTLSTSVNLYMKTKALLLPLLFIALHSNAQNFRAGISTGINVSQIDGDHVSGFSKAGVQLGLFANLPIKKKYEWQLEVMYITKGSKEQPNENGTSSLYQANLSYIEVPILFIYKPTKKVAIEVGPSAGFLINSEEKDITGKLINQPSFNKEVLSANLGVSYKVNKSFLLNLRTNLAITPTRRNLNRVTSKNYIQNPYHTTTEQYNHLISLGVYYRFHKKA